jgi:hypothetical protein
MFLNEDQMKKWTPVLDHADLAPIKDPYRRNMTALMLENTLVEGAWADQILAETTSSIPTNFMGASSSTAGTGGIDTFDPVLISLVRRAMPNLLPYEIMGVQPMNGPTGLVFAMRSRYSNQTGGETFYNEVNTAFTSVVDNANTFGHKNVGTIPGATNTSPLTAVNTYNTATGMVRAQLEALGADSNSAFPEMSFTIEKIMVEAVGRAMAAGYSLELAQDLKRIHGLEAESELSNILISEVLAEINREAVRTINICAKIGAQDNVTTAGVFDLDTDSNGRWLVEKFKGLMFQLEREANAIAKQTRRGKGNIVICSSDVASALQMAGVLDYTPALNRNDNLAVDDTGSTFAGVLNGRLRVYIDPYAIGGNYVTMGYKGSSPFDAGIFYCPYVPLQMVRAVDPQTFQPRIGYKTRYGMVANPYAEGLTKGNGALNINSNVYYRKMIINNLM